MDILETLFSCGIIMQAKYCPQVVHNDPYDHFLVVEITHSGEVVWLVDIYSLNHVTQFIALWGLPLQTLYVDHRWKLAKVDLTCVDASQSMSLHLIVDDPKQSGIIKRGAFGYP